MKETAMRRKRKNMRNQAVQCSQLLSPIMRIYSCQEEEASLLIGTPLTLPRVPCVQVRCPLMEQVGITQHILGRGGWP
jgi:hypothetical protein